MCKEKYGISREGVKMKLVGLTIIVLGTIILCITKIFGSKRYVQSINEDKEFVSLIIQFLMVTKLIAAFLIAVGLIFMLIDKI